MLQLWMCWGLSNFAEASLVRMVWPVRAVWEISATWVANRPRAQTWKSCCHCVDNLDWKLLRSQAEADAIYAAGMRFLQHHIQCFKISSRTKAENSRAKYLACCWTFECAGCNWSAGAWNPRSTCSTTCWSAPRSGDTSPNYYKLTTTSNQFKLVALSAWSMHQFCVDVGRLLGFAAQDGTRDSGTVSLKRTRLAASRKCLALSVAGTWRNFCARLPHWGQVEHCIHDWIARVSSIWSFWIRLSCAKKRIARTVFGLCIFSMTFLKFLSTFCCWQLCFLQDWCGKSVAQMTCGKESWENSLSSR